MSMTPSQHEELARRILAAGDAGASLAPVTDTQADFSLDDAYEVSARIARARVARGERVVGWKIGFTNERMWDEYGVRAPIWAPMYDTTVQPVDDPRQTVSCTLARFVEPRIEPEIVLRIASPPTLGMDNADLLGCVDGVAHGIEIVQSLFPGWRFKAPDTVAAFGLHGCLFTGPFAAIEARARWLRDLSTFAVTLRREGIGIESGSAANVLGGPLVALRHLVEGLADDPLGRGLQPGDLVTTGTITRAFPVREGEEWSTEVRGLPTPGRSVVFADVA